MTPITNRDEAPERGVVIASLPPGADGADELTEMRELLRTARVETVDRAEPAEDRSVPQRSFDIR